MMDPSLKIKREGGNETVLCDRQENKDGSVTSVSSHHLNSQTIIKEEKSDRICFSASPTTLSNPLHTEMCTKKVGSTITLNNTRNQGEVALIAPFPTVDDEHLQTITSLPCQVKTEPPSEDEDDDWEQKSTVNHPFTSDVKKEIIEDEVDQVKISEVEDEREEMNDDESTSSDDAVVKSENDELPQNVSDVDESEQESMSEISGEMNKQQHCGGDDNENQIFKNHINRLCLTSETGHTCSVCGMSFEESQACLWHIWHTHSEQKSFASELSGKALEVRKDVKIHRTNERPYACDICDKTFPKKNSLVKHKIYHSDERPHPCDVCGKAFKERSVLNRHKASCHSSERPYSCDVCGKAFKVRSILNGHKAACHSDERPHSCDICGKAFKVRSVLSRHKAECHSTERPHSCEICGKTFKVSNGLYQHKIVCHSDERPHSCDICGEAFKLRSKLKIHMAASHSDERPYVCVVCGKAFKLRDVLNQHMIQCHSNERPHLCDVCGMAFKLRYVLNQHKASCHSDEKPSCDICGKTFKQQAYLVRHKKVHTGVKPYACEICGKAFQQRWYLVVHEKIHTGEKPFVCEICGKAFLLKQKARLHVQQVHNKEYSPIQQ